MARLALVALLVILGSPAGAHEPGPTRALLSEVERRHAAAREPGAAADTLYRLGEAAEALVELLNRDVAAHGRPSPLTEALVARLRTSGVIVSYRARTRTYAYDLDAFAAYLRRAPEGPHAADASFRLLARDFDVSLGDDLTALGDRDVPALLRAIAAEERFLSDHPQHPQAGRVRFFLAVDYVRAARHLDEAGDAAGFARRARETLGRVARESPDPFEVRAADALREQLAASGR